MDTMMIYLVILLLSFGLLGLFLAHDMDKNNDKNSIVNNVNKILICFCINNAPLFKLKINSNLIKECRIF